MLQLAHSPHATDDMTAVMTFDGGGGRESTEWSGVCLSTNRLKSKVVLSASLKVGCEGETTCTWTEKNKKQKKLTIQQEITQR